MLFRWVGSKAMYVSRLVTAAGADVPRGVGRVVSPFFGSGALELALLDAKIGKALAAYDESKELRTFYGAVRRSPTQVLLALQQLLAAEDVNTREGYLRVRKLNGLGQAAGAARFLYLQTYSFRGIMRLNAKGEHNVPPDKGRLATFRFDTGGLQVELLRLSKHLRHGKVWGESWDEVLEETGEDDVIVSDPPYLGHFGRYSDEPFTEPDHKHLASLLHKLAGRGRRIIAFNSPIAAPLYSGWTTRVDLSRASRMHSVKGKRTLEYLFHAGFGAAAGAALSALARP